MGLFDWAGVDLEGSFRGSLLMHQSGDVATAKVAQDMFRAGIQPDEEDLGRLSRSRWLEANGAEHSFPCGVVPQAEPAPAEPRLNVLPIMQRGVASVVAAVLPHDLVFLSEQESEEIVELGRLPRSAIRDADVVDAAGIHLPEPVHETFESDRLALVVLRWSNEGADDEERFAFRSVWLAWKAARKLQAARQG
jgi:hypothetical protein